MNQAQDFERPASASAVAIVDLQAIKHNYRLLRTLCPTSCEVAPVIKANAYGLGAQAIAEALVTEGARRFFVATLQEAIDLKASAQRFDLTLHTLNNLWPEVLPIAAGHNIVPVLSTLESIQAWQTLAKEQKRTLPFWIQFDTGLNRLGISPEELRTILHAVQDCPKKHPQGLLSHLSSAYTDPEFSEKQRQIFDTTVRHAPRHTLKSFSNSGGCAFGPCFFYDVIRPGRFLYGSHDLPDLKGLPKPKHVLTVQARILQIQTIRPGDPIGYDQTYRAQKSMRIATLGIGYGDGYFQSLSNRGHTCVAGFKAPVVGKVSMDLTTIDVSLVPETVLAQNHWATLINQKQSIDRMASLAQVSPWEVLTHLGKRIPLIYI